MAEAIAVIAVILFFRHLAGHGKFNKKLPKPGSSTKGKLIIIAVIVVILLALGHGHR